MKYNNNDILTPSNVINSSELQSHLMIFCTSVAVQNKIKFAKKSFEDFLKPNNCESFNVTSVLSAEVKKIIYSFDSNKSDDPSCIRTKKSKLLNEQIAGHLVEIFNLSFNTGVFPDSLKIAKAAPIHKKNSRLKFSNYRPISYLIWIKLLKSSCKVDLHIFFNKRRYCIKRNLVFKKIFQ